MKKLLYLFITALLMVLVLSCGDEEEDSCDNVVCYNDGICVDGTCDCPDNYSGDSCQTYTPPFNPNKVRIKKIVVNKFPETDKNSDPWDDEAGEEAPDIYTYVNIMATTVFYSDTLTNVTSAEGPYSWDSDILINNLYSIISVSLYDFDDIGWDDQIGYIQFEPIDYKDSLPSVINEKATFSGREIEFDIHLEWEK